MPGSRNQLPDSSGIRFAVLSQLLLRLFGLKKNWKERAMDAGNLLYNAMDAVEALRLQLAALGAYYVKYGYARRAESLNAYAAKLDSMEIHLACFAPAEDGEGRPWRRARKPK
jgi:hypothetical protein